MNRSWDHATLAYAAGYLDGEGCFWSGRNSKIGITVANTHRPTIEWFQRTFGGSISKPRPPRKPSHRPVYTWQIVARDAVALCQAVVPFLREKAEQALLLIALQQTMGRPLLDRKLHPATISERLHLETLLKETKHVAW